MAGLGGTPTGDDSVGTDGGSYMATKDTGGQRQTTRRAEETEETETGSTEEVRERQEKLSDDVGAIPDESGEGAEGKAEGFVRSYGPKGRQEPKSPRR